MLPALKLSPAFHRALAEAERYHHDQARRFTSINLRAIQSDYRVLGDAIFERFSAPSDKRSSVLWYYRSLYDVYADAKSPVDPRRDRLTLALAELVSWFEDKRQTQRGA